VATQAPLTTCEGAEQTETPAGSPPPSRDDVAGRVRDNLRPAGGDFGKRLDAAVQALRG
jgi:hypothetical protein